MKKMLVLLLMVSVVAGMTLPAMATDGADASAGSSSNGGTNTLAITNNQDASNYAANSVSVELNAAPQSNYLGKNIAASGGNTNGAVAAFDANAIAKDANSGAAVSGDATSNDATSGGASAGVDKVKVGEDNHGDVGANPEAETGDAKSIAKTGDAYTGNAKNVAKVSDNLNSASANDNSQTSGDVNNIVTQFNVQKQITPVYISNDQKVKQTLVVKDVNQDASSNPETIATSDKKIDVDTTTTTTDVDTGDIILAPLPLWMDAQN